MKGGGVEIVGRDGSRRGDRNGREWEREGRVRAATVFLICYLCLHLPHLHLASIFPLLKIKIQNM